MQRRIILVIIIVIIFIITSTWMITRYKSDIERKEMIGSATRISQEYIKKHFDSEFILRDYDLIHPSINTTIFLDGYIKGHEDITISVTYDYEKKEVRDVWGPKWFIESEIK